VECCSAVFSGSLSLIENHYLIVSRFNTYAPRGCGGEIVQGVLEQARARV
jgi:hypothetical protein